MKYIEEALKDRFGGISQMVLMRKIETYLKQKDRDLKLSEGYCYSLALLWGYQTLLGTENEFFDRVQKISKWNGIDDYDIEFEKLFSRIEWLQRHQEISGIAINRFEEFMSVLTSPEVKKEYMVSFVFKEQEVISSLEQILKNPGKVALVSSHNHATAIMNVNGVYRFYDSNWPEGVVEFKTVADLVKNTRKGLLQAFVFENSRIDSARNIVRSALGSKTWPENIPLSINVFDLEGRKPGVYPKNLIEDLVSKRTEKNRGINNTGWEGISSVRMAASEEDLESLKSLINLGADINILDEQGYTPLYRALNIDCKNIVQYIIDHGGDIDLTYKIDGKIMNILEVACRTRMRPDDFIPILKEAITKGKIEMLTNVFTKRLLPHPIKDFRIDGDSLLHFLVKAKRPELLADLLQLFREQDVNIDEKNKLGQTLLESAKLSGDKQTIQQLLDYKLEEAVNKSDLATIKQLTTEFSEFISDKDYFVKCELHIAIKNNDSDNVKKIINSHPKAVNFPSIKTGLSPLMTALDANQISLAKFLLDNGADAKFAMQDYTALHLAAMHGDSEIIERLVKSGLDINKATREGTPLIMAAGYGETDVIFTLMKLGADFKLNDRNDNNLLHILVSHGHFDTLKQLLEDKTTQKDLLPLLNKPNISGQTPMQVAATTQHQQIINYLLDLGGDLKTVDNDGNTLLHLAATSSNVEIIKDLLKRGLDPHAKNKNEQTALDRAISRGFLNNTIFLIANTPLYNDWTNPHSALKHSLQNYHQNIALYLIDKEIEKNINAKDDKGFTIAQGVVNSSISSSEKQILLQQLIQKKADINIKNQDGMTCLHYAVLKGDLNLVKLLIENGADYQQKDNNNQTALDLTTDVSIRDYIQNEIFRQAVLKTDIATLKKINAKDFINRKDNNGDTVLHLAIRNKLHVYLIKYLVNECKADVNIKNKDMESALHLATKTAPLQITSCLMTSNANYFTRNAKGETLLHSAIDANKPDHVEAFIKKTESLLFIKDDLNRTPLHHAVLKGDLKMLNFLITKGLNVNATDLQGMTPLELAIDLKQKPIINLLVDSGAKFDTTHKKTQLNSQFYTDKDMPANFKKENNALLKAVIETVEKNSNSIKNRSAAEKLENFLENIKNISTQKHPDDLKNTLLAEIQKFEKSIKSKSFKENLSGEKNVGYDVVQSCKEILFTSPSAEGKQQIKL